MAYRIKAYELIIVLSIATRVSLYNGEFYNHPKPPRGCLITGSKVNWGPTEIGKCTVSQPLCVDERWAPVARCCNHSGWSPEPNCTIQPPPAPCPKEYQYHVAKELCYRLTDQTTFPPRCGNEDTVPFDEYRQILDDNVTDPVWMPITRDYSDGVGFPVWTELSYRYKLLYEASSGRNLFQLDNEMQDCFVYHNRKINSVSCQKKYKGICAYNKLENVNSYCGQKIGLCKAKHYRNHTECVCVHYTASTEGEPPNATDILHPFQNLIIKSITSDDCMIGLRQTGDGSFRWTQSNEKLNYSYWSTDITHLRGYTYGVFTHNGWNLTTAKDADANCRIHDQNVTALDPKLTLVFNNNAQIFELLLQNKDDLRQFSDSNEIVYCFTDVEDVYVTNRLTSLNNAGDMITFAPLEKGPGHYWCEAINYFNFEVVRSNTILYYPREKYGCEYVVILSYVNGTTLEATSLKAIHNQYSINFRDYDVRIFKIVSVDTLRNEIKLNLHFTQNITNSSSVRSCTSEYSLLQKRLKHIKSVYPNSKTVLSATHCMPETDSFGNKWPITEINKFPNILCLTETWTFVRRHCSGNFTDGAHWEPLREKCKIHSCSNESTEDLYALLISNDTAINIVDNLYKITKVYSEFSSLGIFLIGAIVSKITAEIPTDCLAKLLNVTSLVNKLDRKTLKHSQETFNATDHILYGLDKIFSKVYLPRSNPKVSLHSENMLMKAVDISVVNISGVVLYKNGHTYDLDYLDATDNLSSIVEAPTFQSAVVLPEQLRRQIVNSQQSDHKLVFVVYVIDSLFNSDSNDTMSTKNISQIFNVLIPNFTEPFIKPLEIYFKTSDMIGRKSCAYWRFLNIKGLWKNDSNSLPMESGVKCDFWHVTHFALLFLESSDEFINFDHVLDLITDVNCVLSLLGLLFILLTAVLFKRWRTNTGNRILINFVFAIAFQTSLLYISDLVYRFVKVNDICTIVGAMLHYSIISEFFWMFIVAILQFKRFVEVLGGQPKYIMLKACVVGWILPLFPVLCVLFLDPKSYVKNTVGLCYPSGISLYLSIWTPVGIIVAINFVIFTYILYSVATKNTECLIGNKESYYQWRLAVLLFFMLGLTWSFGLLIQLDFGILFVYLFTFSATLQGFVMFLFFIIFNKNTRILYMQYMRKCFYPHK